MPGPGSFSQREAGTSPFLGGGNPGPHRTPLYPFSGVSGNISGKRGNNSGRMHLFTPEEGRSYVATFQGPIGGRNGFQVMAGGPDQAGAPEPFRRGTKLQRSINVLIHYQGSNDGHRPLIYTGHND